MNADLLLLDVFHHANTPLRIVDQNVDVVIDLELAPITAGQLVDLSVSRPFAVDLDLDHENLVLSQVDILDFLVHLILRH